MPNPTQAEIDQHWARHYKLERLLAQMPLGLREQLIHVVEYAGTAVDAARGDTIRDDLPLALAALESQLDSFWIKLDEHEE